MEIIQIDWLSASDADDRFFIFHFFPPAGLAPARLGLPVISVHGSADIPFHFNAIIISSCQLDIKKKIGIFLFFFLK